MKRRIVHFVLSQTKFISNSPSAEQRKGALCNEKLKNSKPISGPREKDDNKSLCAETKLESIKSSNSKLLFAFNSKFLIVLRNYDDNTVPAIEESIFWEDIPTVRLKNLLKWFSKSEDSGGKDPMRPAARLGRLDAANEDGFFYRTERSRLKDLKKKLKDKSKDDPTQPKKT